MTLQASRDRQHDIIFLQTAIYVTVFIRAKIQEQVLESLNSQFAVDLAQLSCGHGWCSSEGVWACPVTSYSGVCILQFGKD